MERQVALQSIDERCLVRESVTSKRPLGNDLGGARMKSSIERFDLRVRVGQTFSSITRRAISQSRSIGGSTVR